MFRRRLVQTFSLLALHASWGPQVKWLCNPVLSCHSCALSWFACPIGVFVHYAGYGIFPFLALGMVLLAGAFFGRLLCGWVCPFGFLQDLLYKLPSPKFTLPEWTRYVKYGVLAVTVFAIPYALGESTLWSFCRGCPAATLQVGLPGWIGGGFGMPSTSLMIRLAILTAILVLVVMSLRGFCRVFCPIGALMAPLNFLSLWAVAPMSPCRSCQKCDRACPTDVQPSRKIDQGEPPSRQLDCIVCHDCQGACPEGRPQKKRNISPAQASIVGETP